MTKFFVKDAISITFGIIIGLITKNPWIGVVVALISFNLLKDRMVKDQSAKN